MRGTAPAVRGLMAAILIVAGPAGALAQPQPQPGPAAAIDLGSPEAELNRPIGTRIGQRVGEAVARRSAGLSTRLNPRLSDHPASRAAFRQCPACAGTADQ